MALLGLVFALPAVPGPAFAREPLRDEPVVWYAEDREPIPVPEFQEPGLVPYAVDSFVGRPFSRFWHPGRFFRWVGTGDRAPEAGDINSLDEVVNSTWFTNRIGLAPLTRAELAEGSAHGRDLAAGPDRSAPWTIVGAKTAGVTPGFRIKDAKGDVWLLKFDPPSHPGMTIRSGVVTSLLFHAIGFHVPVDRLVTFSRADLVVGEGAMMRLQRVGEVPMTEANLDSVLTATGSIFGGEYHALASRYLDGKPLGPFDDQGMRRDDPNDTIHHQDRRELRALQVFGAWVNHFDTKMHNSLDMYEGEPGQGHVRHYLIDFASTLGAFGDTPVKRFGFEYGFDVFPITGRTLTLGLVEDDWVPLERPEGLDEVGLFDVANFEADGWKPDLPHSAMADMTARDGYWAAKILSAFTDEDLRLIVGQGHYQNPAAVDFLVETLAGRRDKIVRHWFGKIPPLDFFTLTAAGLAFHDLAVERGYADTDSPRYRYRMSTVNSDRGQDDEGWTPWRETTATLVPLFDEAGRLAADVPPGGAEYPFLAVEVQVDHGAGWSRSTTVYGAYASGRLVALDR
ncbi:MAG: hypothetical protein ABFS42_11350 [Candidatus Krumholzibacteriota bacterium]